MLGIRSYISHIRNALAYHTRCSILSFKLRFSKQPFCLAAEFKGATCKRNRVLFDRRKEEFKTRDHPSLKSTINSSAKGSTKYSLKLFVFGLIITYHFILSLCDDNTMILNYVISSLKLVNFYYAWEWRETWKGIINSQANTDKHPFHLCIIGKMYFLKRKMSQH